MTASAGPENNDATDDLTSLRRAAQQLRADRDLTAAMELEAVIHRREAGTPEPAAAGGGKETPNDV